MNEVYENMDIFFYIILLMLTIMELRKAILAFGNLKRDVPVFFVFQLAFFIMRVFRIDKKIQDEIFQAYKSKIKIYAFLTISVTIYIIIICIDELFY